MANPYAGIITPELKELHKNLIDALLEDDALTRPCRLIYGDTKFTPCVNCFTANAMIHTISGYKPICDIQVGEKVYNGIYYDNVQHTSMRWYHGDLYNIKPWGISMLDWVTPNHKIPIVRNMKSRYTQKQWYDASYVLQNVPIEEIKAQHITCDDAILLPFNQINYDDLESVVIEGFGTIDIDDDLLFMLGWWIAEGCIHMDTYPRVGSFCLCASKEEHIADRLFDILMKKFGLVSKKEFRADADNLLLTWYSASLTRWMLSFGHRAENKCISTDLWQGLSLRQKRIVLEAYFSGDGNCHSNEQVHIYQRKSMSTVSKQLAYQMYHILTDLDYMPSIIAQPAYTDKNDVHHQESYTILWHEDRRQQKNGIRKTSQGWLAKVREISTKRDTIAVYNIQVENIHKYVANGILVNNCVYDPISGKSSNRYKSGGPIPFPDGQTCPHCNGEGRVGDEQTEDVYLCVLWENKFWLDTGRSGDNRPSQSAHTADAQVMTFSKFDDTFDKLRRAKEVIFDTDVELSSRQRYVKLGEPLFCGLGAANYAVAYWKKAGA